MRDLGAFGFHYALDWSRIMSQSQIDAFLDWLKSFDHHLLYNEDDVESKFVLPLFHHLGYPDTNRRGKYPLDIYTPGRPGRKPEIDQVYFGTSDPGQQNANTSLVIIEAKEPGKANLAQDVAQAQFYGAHLKPLLLVVTNGYHLKVLKRHRHRDEESIFDGTIEELQGKETAVSLFSQLSFETVKHLKEVGANELTHFQYAQLDQALRCYPDLVNILEKGDFRALVTREGNRVTVVRPKAAIVCELPIAFDEGSCEIEFSNITLRGLKIYLSHNEILGNLMTGLHTPLSWSARRFLQPVTKNTFQACFGHTTAILSGEEANDLCACVDDVCQEYKEIITTADTLLETWNYEPDQYLDIRGFRLCSVKQWLWELMKRFAEEFDCTHGKSEWHLFEPGNSAIRIGPSGVDRPCIWPKVDINVGLDLLPNGYIDLLYDIGIPVRLREERWQHDVGPRGLWTARYTNDWILKRWIPEIRRRYPKEFELHRLDKEPVIDYQLKRDSLQRVEDLEQLGPYLRDVQSWLMGYHLNMDAKPFRSYYAAFTEIVKRTEPATLDLEYSATKLSAADSFVYSVDRAMREKIMRHYEQGWTYDEVIECLDGHVSRITDSAYENSHIADDISRVFISVVERGTVNYLQTHLNAAKQALLPLWEQSRFEERYVLPNR
jgi:hypothetical protein